MYASDKKWTSLNSASTPEEPLSTSVSLSLSLSLSFLPSVLLLEEAWPTIALINNGDAQPRRAWGAPDQESNENFAPPPRCV